MSDCKIDRCRAERCKYEGNGCLWFFIIGWVVVCILQEFDSYLEKRFDAIDQQLKQIQMRQIEDTR